MHPVLTTLAVVVTANHFWLDGIVAAGLLGLSMLAVQTVDRFRIRHRRPGPATVTVGAVPVPVAVPVARPDRVAPGG